MRDESPGESRGVARLCCARFELMHGHHPYLSVLWFLLAPFQDYERVEFLGGIRGDIPQHAVHALSYGSLDDGVRLIADVVA
jgi:hypothetical protein